MCDLCSVNTTRLSRRGLVFGGAALAGMSMMAPGTAWSQAATPQNAISPDAALERLMEGNARYAANTSANNDYSAGRAARVNAQYPIAAILSCADARVAPELAFDQGPGDLFVVRVAGNFLNDDGLASFEYAVKYLNAPLLMVLGHSNCGAVGATIKVIKDGVTLPGHLQDMIRDIKPAVETAEKAKPADLLSASIAENVRLAAHRLETASPILSEYVSSGKVKVVGAEYDLATGQIALL